MLSLNVRWTKSIWPISTRFQLLFRTNGSHRDKTYATSLPGKKDNHVQHEFFDYVKSLEDRGRRDTVPPQLWQARENMDKFERRGNIVDHNYFLKCMKTLYQYGCDDEIEMWCSKYRDKSVEYIDYSYPINSLLIDVYLNQKRFDDALEALRYINAKTSLEYCNAYRSVINGLAINGRVDQAITLFEEMFTVFFNHTHDREHYKGNQLTFQTLLNACIPKNGRFDEQQADDDSYSIEDIQERHAKGMAIFKHFNQSGSVIYNEFMVKVREWFSSDPVNNWIIKDCEVNVDGICSNCGSCLQQKEPLESYVAKDIQDFILSYLCKELMSNSYYKTTLETFSVFLDKNGPFDIIVDGMNVGFDTSHPHRKQKSLCFDEEQVFKVVNYFASKGKKVLVTLKLFLDPEWKSKSRTYYRFLSLPNCSIFHTHFYHDDLLILYALAFHGMSARVITKDTFESHAISFPSPLLRYKFLKWVGHQRVLFCFIGNPNDVQVKIFGENYDHCLQWTDSSFHLFCTAFRVKCVQKEM